MFKLRITVVALLALLLIGLGLAVGLLLPQWLRRDEARPGLDTATLLKQVQALSQLVTVKYVVEKVVVQEDVKWFGDNRVILVAHGVVKAGVDLAELRASDLQVLGKTIVIRLPPARITDAYLDDRQTRVVERTTGLLRVFDKHLEQAARHHAVEDIRRAARHGGILKDAEDSARLQLTSLCRQLGFEEVEFRGTEAPE